MTAPIPTVTIDLAQERAEATFDYPGYDESYCISVLKLDEPWDDDGHDLWYRLTDDSGADCSRFRSFHEAVEALLRLAADQMDEDRDRRAHGEEAR